MWSLDWDLENQRKMAVLPSGSSVFGRTRRITNETWTRLLLFLGNSAQAQWCVLCRRTEVRSALPRRTEGALNPGAGPPSPYCCDPKLQHLLRRSPRCEWVWQVGEHVKDLSDASCSRISESTEGFRQGGRELEEGAPSSGVGGRVGVSSLDVPEAEGTMQTGLGACAEEEAGRKVFPPAPGTREACCSSPYPPSWRRDPVPP